MSLCQSELLKDWKDEIVTQILEAGSRQLPLNYLPVSLVSVKILGGIIKEATMTFVETKKLINS